MEEKLEGNSEVMGLFVESTVQSEGTTCIQNTSFVPCFINVKGS